MTRAPSQAGFSLIELLIATGLILIIASTVTGALLQMTKHQQTVWNRTEMHSGIRGATELMQQEVGQAGRSPSVVPRHLRQQSQLPPVAIPRRRQPTPLQSRSIPRLR